MNMLLILGLLLGYHSRQKGMERVNPYLPA
jgi:hypothetical protein